MSVLKKQIDNPNFKTKEPCDICGKGPVYVYPNQAGKTLPAWTICQSCMKSNERTTEYYNLLKKTAEPFENKAGA